MSHSQAQSQTQSSSGSYMDYMDGVPVKISDKYKPPPEISLPYGALEASGRATDLVNNTHYDFSLETNVLKKLVEWQNVRETIKNARNHRLQLLEEAKQRELDLKAVTETEEKLKQLSISEVSYPSTEEISEISPDDNDQTKVVSSPNDSFVETAPESNVYSIANVTKPDIVCDILQPVPVSPTPLPWSVPPNLLDDPHPLPLALPQMTRTQKSLHYIKNNYMKNNVDNLTYSDFENDTSSPFDNMELKTINDKELLAQVLNINQTNVPQSYEGNTCGGVDATQIYNGYISNQYSSSHSTTNVDSHPSKLIYSTSLHGDVTTTAVSNTVPPYVYPTGGVLNNNGYYQESSSTGVVESGKPMSYLNTTVNYYAPEYNYSTLNTSYQPLTNVNLSDKPFLYDNKLGEQSYNVGTSQYQRDNISNINQSYVNPYGYYNANYYYPNVSNTTYLPLNKDETPGPQESDIKVESKTSLFGSRSRSVPDIVKELDEEVAMARIRAKERSHNCSPSIRPTADAVSIAAKKVEMLHNPYNDLSPELQGICNRISSMGFPLERVARACEDMGAEDKKIIDYLLLMGQLIDLGFPESSVSKALLKHNCDRDKAVDELVS